MEKLGIEPQLLLAQLVNFLVIFAVLTKLLYKPILDVIEKRKKEIAEGLELTEKMKLASEKQKEKEEKLLAEARKEARAIVEAAEKDAEAVKKDILAKAHDEAERIVEKGKHDVVDLRVHMEKDVKDAAVELAATMAKRLVSSVLSAADQHKLIAKQVKELS